MSDEKQTPEPQGTVFVPATGSQAPVVPATPPPEVPAPALASPNFSMPPASTGFGTPSPPSGMGADGILVPGTELNHMYQITRFIAKGGMGMVYEGQGIYDNERVAIKTILPHLAADQTVIAMFQREASTLTQLRHDALVQYRGLTKEPQFGFFYLVTEFIDGRSLEKMMEDGAPVPVSEAADLLRRIASGLAVAHSVGCVHRDIAPDNVLVPNGDMHRAKVIDFGIARDAKAKTGTIVGDGFAGKLNFAAPEQFGKYGREIGPWTDVYSLGLVIAGAVRGKEIDMGGTMSDALDRRVAVPDLSGIPDPLRGVLAAMLEPEPAKRLRDMPAVIARLDQAPSAVSSKSTKKSAPPKPTKTAPPKTVPPGAGRSSANLSPQKTPLGLPLPILLGGGGVLAAVFIAGGLALILRPKPAPLPEVTPDVASAALPIAPALPTGVERRSVQGPSPSEIAGLPPESRDRLAKLMDTLQAMQCAWLTVKATPEGGFEISGAAQNKDAVIDAAAANQARARVGQLSGSICSSIEAMRTRMVPPGDPLQVQIRRMPNDPTGLQAVVSGVPPGGELYFLELDRNKGFLPVLDLRDPQLEAFRKFMRDATAFSGSVSRGGDFTFQFAPSEAITDGKNGVVAIAVPTRAASLDTAFRTAAEGLMAGKETTPLSTAQLVAALDGSGAWTVAMDFYPPE